jgi:hypothetical protein
MSTKLVLYHSLFKGLIKVYKTRPVPLSIQRSNNSVQKSVQNSSCITLYSKVWWKVYKKVYKTRPISPSDESVQKSVQNSSCITLWWKCTKKCTKLVLYHSLFKGLIKVYKTRPVSLSIQRSNESVQKSRPTKVYTKCTKLVVYRSIQKVYKNMLTLHYIY